MNLYLFNDNNLASAFGIGTYIKELVSALESSDIHIHIVHLHAVRPKFEIEKTDRIENWYISEICDDTISFTSSRNIEDYSRNVLYLLRLYITDEYEGMLYKETDRVIALSQYTKKLLLNEYHLDPAKVSVIPNGLDEATPVPEANREALRNKWQVYENESLILFVGRLHVAKGLMFLLKTFRKLLGKKPNCRLMIVGTGDYNTYVQEVKDICTKVSFTGFLEKNELYELYLIADVCVFPSLTENCSYVAIEMMMHGLPLIACSSTGLKEMIEDGMTGLHIPVVEYPDKVDIDTDLLAEKMLYLLNHPEERKRMGANARFCYETVYAVKIFRKNMLNFYHSLF